MAEQGCLLSSYPDKIGIGGSNPPLSATALAESHNELLDRLICKFLHVFGIHFLCPFGEL